MFFRFDLAFDPSEWEALKEQGAVRLGRLGEGLASQDWTLYLLWANRGDSTGYVVAATPRAEPDPGEIASLVVATVGGRVVEVASVEVELPTDRPLLDAERWQLVTTAAVRGPDKTCESCGGIPPDHLEKCALRRAHTPAAVPTQVPATV